MPEPSYYQEGTTPRLRDTRMKVWTKILGETQNLDGALAANNPRPRDTLRVIKQKWLNALNSTAYTG